MMNSTFHAKVNDLKRAEKACYQINYFMLQNEGDALRITKRVLLELARDESFLQQSFDEQKRMLLKCSVHHIFSLKRET